MCLLPFSVPDVQHHVTFIFKLFSVDKRLRCLEMTQFSVQIRPPLFIFYFPSLVLQCQKSYSMLTWVGGFYFLIAFLILGCMSLHATWQMFCWLWLIGWRAHFNSCCLGLAHLKMHWPHTVTVSFTTNSKYIVTFDFFLSSVSVGSRVDGLERCIKKNKKMKKLQQCWKSMPPSMWTHSHSHLDVS